EVVVGLRPEEIRPAADGAIGFDSEVVITEQLGPEVLAYLQVDGIRAASVSGATTEDRDASADLRGTLVARLPGDTPLKAGDRLAIAPNVENVNLFDAGSGEALAAVGNAPDRN
ncbi:MAG TPA: TOBE domain-containing protein, partial [Phytomonospora sp.]